MRRSLAVGVVLAFGTVLGASIVACPPQASAPSASSSSSSATNATHACENECEGFCIRTPAGHHCDGILEGCGGVALEHARANVIAAQHDYERARYLFERGEPKKDLDEAKAYLDDAKAALARAERQATPSCAGECAKAYCGEATCRALGVRVVECGAKP